MTPHALLLLLAKVTAVLGAALVLARLLRHASAGTRHLVWLATLAALLLVPAVEAWTPLRLAVLPDLALPGAPAAALPSPAAPAPAAPAPARPAPSPVAAVELDAPVVEGALGTQALAAPPAARPAPAPAAALRPATALLLVWLGGLLAITAWLAQGWLAARRIVRRARPIDDPAWQSALYDTADRVGLDDAPQLVRSADVRMPFACGLVRPTVVLPEGCDAWPADRRQAVLFHELAHVRRRDLLGHTLGRAVCAVYWFHPLVWLAAARLRAESERACDDLVVRCGTRAADYAEHLLDIVTGARGEATPAVAVAMARRNEFEGRLLAILDPDRRREGPTRTQAAAVVLALGGVAVLVGAAGPATAAATPTGSLAHRSQPPVLPRTTTRPVPPAPPTPGPLVPGPLVPGRLVPDGPVPGTLVPAAPAPSPSVPAAPQADVTAQADATPAPATASADARADSHAAAHAERLTAEIQAQLHRASPAEAPPAQAADARVPLLARVLRADTSTELRRVAAWGLAEHARAPEAASALATALGRDPAPRVREMAAWALADSRRQPDVRDALIAALRSDRDPRVRATTAWALGELGDDAAVPALASALADPSPALRLRAAWAIGAIEPRAVPAALLARLTDDERTVRRAAAWAVAKIEDPAAVPALRAAVRAEQDSAVRRAHVRALAALGERSVDALRELLDSSDPAVREQAVRGLAGGATSSSWPWPWPDPRPIP